MNPQLIVKVFLLSAISTISASLMSAPVALQAAPALLDKLSELKDTLDAIRTNQVLVAAIRFKSLLPDFALNLPPVSEEEEQRKVDLDDLFGAEEEQSDNENEKKAGEDSDSDSDSDSELDEVDLLTSRQLLIKSFVQLVKQLPRTALRLINGFDVTEPSAIIQFTEAKESENAQVLAESLTIIQSIKTTLRLDDSSTPAHPFTFKTLSILTSKLAALENNYENFQELQNKPSKPKKKQQALVQLKESQDKIAKNVRKIADFVREI